MKSQHSVKFRKYKPLQIYPPPPPPQGLARKIALKYKVKTVNLLPTIRPAQSVSKRKFPSVNYKALLK